MVLENGDTVRVSGRQGTFTITKPIVNMNGVRGYLVVAEKTLQSHFYREADIQPIKKRGRA